MADIDPSGGTAAGEAPPADIAGALPALAGGLAHDLNNVLSAALMMVDLLEGSCTGERERAVLAAMDELARRGVALGRQMLWLARGVAEPTLFQPKYLLADLQRAARAILPASVAIGSDFSPHLPMLRGDPLRLYRLLLELCLAVRDGLAAAGGVLTFAAWNLELDEVAAAQRPGSAAGPHVVLEVACSAGEGDFPAAVAAAIEACGGFSEAVPKAGGGQGFRVVLPAAHAADTAGTANAADIADIADTADAAAGPPPFLAANDQEGKGELILLAESEAAVREAMAGVLEKHGYRVLSAGDGAEAVALFAREGPPVAAVVAAADLPYLGGAGVLRAVRRLRDGVPAVVTGGCGLAAYGDSVPPVLLAKPFTAPALLAAVRRALGGETGTAQIPKNL